MLMAGHCTVIDKCALQNAQINLKDFTPVHDRWQFPKESLRGTVVNPHRFALHQSTLI